MADSSTGVFLTGPCIAADNNTIVGCHQGPARRVERGGGGRCCFDSRIQTIWAAVESAAAHLGIYRRVIRASLDRVWENVLDWEHLPHLHKDSFRAITPSRVDRDGWRASVELADGGAAEIDVALDRPRLRYLTRTLAGAGAGGEIETVLSPRTDRATAIEVSFRLPGVPDDAKALVFDYFRSLYTKLWDEDEGMMRERQAYLDERVATRVRTRTIEIDGECYAIAAVCPHLGGPLDAAQVADGCIVCPWHGYRFDVRTGECVSGQAFRLAVAKLDTPD